MDHIWVMLDHDGEQTLYQLIEAGDGSDAARLVRMLQMPAYTVDLVLLDGIEKQLEPIPDSRTEATRARLIVVKLHARDDREIPILASHQQSISP